MKKSDLSCIEDVRFTLPWIRLIYDVFNTPDLGRFEDVERNDFFFILYCLKYSENFKCFCLLFSI